MLEAKEARRDLGGMGMIDIPAMCDTFMQSKEKSFPRQNNRSSDIGDDCERKLVYERTHWEAKKKPDLGLLYVFDMGNNLEDPIVRRMQDSGVKIIRQQDPFVHKENGETLITGHIDGIIDEICKQTILEIKTMNEHIWESVESVEDFKRWHWTRKYPPQLNIYCFGLEIPNGLWILINKSTGRLKQINWQLDYDMAENTLKRCKRINDHVKNNTLPDCLPNTPENADYCEGCSFRDICQPPINRESLELIVDADLIAKIEEHFSLEQQSKKYEDLKEWLKETKLHGIKRAAIGPYLYDGTKRIWKQRWTKA